MKKFIFVMLVLVLGVCGCTSEEDKNPVIYDDYGRDVLPGEADYHYTFTGESEHFTFSDGIADYRDDKAEFWIKELKIKNNEKFSATISVYFNNRLLSTQKFDNKSIKEYDIVSGVYGKKIKRDSDGRFYGDIDAFMETKPEDFESQIKIIANYCDKNDNCSNEDFKLDVIKHDYSALE